MMDVEHNNWTATAKTSWRTAIEIAQKKEHTIVNCCHLFCSLWDNASPSLLIFLENHGLDISAKHVHSLVDSYAQKNKNLFYGKEDEEAISLLSEKSVKSASKLAKQNENSFIGVEHFIFGVLEADEKFSEFLFENGIDTEHLKLCIAAFTSGEDLDVEFEEGDDEDEEDDDRPIGSALEKYCVNLNELTSSNGFPKISGRDMEIKLIEETLCRKTKSNCILIGEAGTGKTSVVEGVSQMISQENYNGPLKNKQIFSLDVGALVAGTKYRGQFEERFSNLLKVLKKNPDYVLFIDEIHTIIGSGSKEGTQDLANLLKPALARGEIKCIGATTSTEFKKYFEKDAALTRRFHPINIDEPTTEMVVEMLAKALPSYEEHHNVKFSKKLIQTCVDMCAIYLPHQKFPDKAFDVIDQASSKARINNKNVSYDDICSVIAEKIKVDVETIKINSKKSFDCFIDSITSSVFGQTNQLNEIYDILSCAKAGLTQPNKPIANFFFVGATGVGKTFAAKQIAKEFYGNEKSFLQLNMSEYQEHSSISRLIGASAGYVGYEDGGILTEFVRKNPNSLILFDEAEKCNPNILNLLLQILDEAEIKDNLNRTVDFSRCIIVVTSNVGSNIVNQQQLGFAPTAINYSESYKTSVQKLLSPELVARIDSIIVFDELNQEALEQIFKTQISILKNSLAKKKLNVNFNIEFNDLFENKSESIHARSIKKQIKTQIEIPLAKFIVKNRNQKEISVKMLDGKLNLC